MRPTLDVAAGAQNAAGPAPGSDAAARLVGAADRHTGSVEAKAHRLEGVRLGEMQRWLLLAAPSPEALEGFVLEHPDRSVQETMRAAAARLEQAGLVDRYRVPLYTRARDPRGERLVFRDGAFWTRKDPTRAHAVRRTVIWQSPFGVEIVKRYRRQLESGAAIRWDPRTVRSAFERKARVPDQHRRVQLANMEEEARDAVVLADHSRRALTPAVPDDVMASGDTERWELATAVAHDQAPDARPDALWEHALELWRSSSVEELRAAAPTTPKAKLTAAETFRRRRRSALGR